MTSSGPVPDTPVAGDATYRVLLVEDNPVDALLVEQMLRNQARGLFALARAERLDEALAAVARERFDAILLDLFLPDCEGFATLSALRARAPYVPIVVLSWNVDAQRTVETINLGAEDCLLKAEVNPPVLVRAIRHGIERRRVDRALRESQERLRLLVDSVRDYALFMLDLQGRVASWNTGAERLTGYGADEVIGRPASVFFEATEEPEVRLARAIAAAGETGRYECECGWTRKDGTARRGHAVLTGLRDEQDARRGFALVVWDVTTARELEEQLRHAQKMEAVGRLAGGVAHDFNNLLTGIMGYCDLLDREVNGPADAAAHVALVVRDTGVGMDPDTLARVFEPFFTTKPLGVGTGLGLSTVYGIVRQSGGQVLVESEPGSGAAFTVLLPRCGGARPRARERPRPSGECLGGARTILVAEDDDTVRHPICLYLRQRGFHVLAAGGGPEALDLLVGGTATVDLLLTDVVMPGMSGVELAHAAAAVKPELRLLYMSGYTDNSNILQGASTNGLDLLRKPFGLDELGDKIREVLERDRSAVTPAPSGPAGCLARRWRDGE